MMLSTPPAEFGDKLSIRSMSARIRIRSRRAATGPLQSDVVNLPVVTDDDVVSTTNVYRFNRGGPAAPVVVSAQHNVIAGPKS